MTPYRLYGMLAVGGVLTIGIVLSLLMTLVYLFELHPPLGFSVTTLALCATARDIVRQWLRGDS